MISVSLYLWNWILVKYFNYKINIEIYYMKNHNFIGKVHNQTLACLAQKPAQLTKYSHSIAPWFVSTPHTRSFFESTAVTEQSSITPTPKKKTRKTLFVIKTSEKYQITTKLRKILTEATIYIQKTYLFRQEYKRKTVKISKTMTKCWGAGR